MNIRHSHFGVVVAAMLLSGCSAVDSVWSSLSGDDSDTASATTPQSSSSKGGGGTVVAIPPANAELNPQPTLGARQPPAVGTTSYTAPPVTPGSPTGTLVGAKVA